MAKFGKPMNRTADNPVMSFIIPMMLIGVVVIMIIPIPSFFLDILLSFNISLALIILFVSLYLGRPLEFSSYPSLILMTTYFDWDEHLDNQINSASWK